MSAEPNSHPTRVSKMRRPPRARRAGNGGRCADVQGRWRHRRRHAGTSDGAKQEGGGADSGTDAGIAAVRRRDRWERRAGPAARLLRGPACRLRMPACRPARSGAQCSRAGRGIRPADGRKRPGPGRKSHRRQRCRPVSGDRAGAWLRRRAKAVAGNPRSSTGCRKIAERPPRERRRTPVWRAPRQRGRTGTGRYAPPAFSRAAGCGSGSPAAGCGRRRRCSAIRRTACRRTARRR